MDLKTLKEVAKQRNGNILSTKYINAKYKYRWSCCFGHIWNASWANISKGKWCPVCAGKIPPTHKELQNFVKLYRGKLVTKKIGTSKDKLLWKCHYKHTWKSKYGHIISGSWCPKCSQQRRGLRRRNSIDLYRKLANTRGGFYLESKFKTTKEPHRWKCCNGHTWTAQPSNIINGNWCPECNSGFGERVCRLIFETIFDVSFPKKKPEWLITKEGTRLELDGYSEKLSIAFEHQGAQHFRSNNRFTRNENDLRKRKDTDKKKRELCKKNKVLLVIVPEIPTLLSLNKTQEYIEAKLRLHAINFKSKKVDLNKAFINSDLKRLDKICKIKSGYIKSKSFNYKKMVFVCRNRHEWATNPKNILDGTWCPSCAGVKKKTIYDMKLLAKTRNGKCVSKKYINAHSKLKWQCKNGHIWLANYANVYSKKWCPQCRGHNKSITDMQRVARLKQGRVLSKTYVNIDTPLKWECKRKHIWFSTPRAIIHQNSWCNACRKLEWSNPRKLDIKRMVTIAKLRGGKCLSKKYIDSKTKLEWQCKKKHKWFSIPTSVVKGHWCPQCARMK